MDRTRAAALSARILFITVMITAGNEAWTSGASSRAIKPGDLAFARNSARIAVHAAGRGNPWINLQDAYPLEASFGGAEAHSITMEPGSRPLTLAAADVDEDGVPDLLCGYGTPGGGVLKVYRGNIDSIYPGTPEAEKRKSEGTFIDSPFFPMPATIELPVQPAFLGAGDFDADGHVDVVASDGTSNVLCWLRGDGRGGWLETRVLELPGSVTALVSGEINQLDGLTDLVLGTEGPEGPRVLIYQSSAGALMAEPEVLRIDHRPVALALGQLDDQAPLDLAVAAGSELITVSGRERSSSASEAGYNDCPLSLVRRSSFPAPVIALAVGDFIWDPAHETDVAVLLDEGRIHFLQRGGAIEAPEQDVAMEDAEGATIWRANVETSLLVDGRRSAPLKAVLLPARVSSLPTDDLVVVDPDSNQVHLVMGNAQGWHEQQPAAFIPAESVRRIPVSLDIDGQPVAVLAMRLNIDALSDLVILKDGPQAMAVAVSAATATFTVNSTGDASDANTADGVCDTDLKTSGNQCTFRAAIEQANATAGMDTIRFEVTKVKPVQASLPRFRDPVTLDGTLTGGGRVELDLSAQTPGIRIDVGRSVVRGMVINGSLAVLS